MPLAQKRGDGASRQPIQELSEGYAITPAALNAAIVRLGLPSDLPFFTWWHRTPEFFLAARNVAHLEHAVELLADAKRELATLLKEQHGRWKRDM